MLNPADVGSMLTEDFLNYSLSELQKIFFLVFGDDANPETDTFNTNQLLFKAVSNFGFSVPKSISGVSGSANWYDYDFFAYPGMSRGYNIGSNFRPAEGVPYYPSFYDISNFNITVSSEVLTLSSWYSSGISDFRVSSGGSYNFHTPSINVDNSTYSAVYNTAPYHNLLIGSSPHWGGFYTNDPEKPVFLITGDSGLANLRVSGDAVLKITGSSNTDYTFNDFRNTLVDLPQFPNYVPPTWDDLLSHDIYIPDFYPSQLPNLEFNSEIPFDVELPRNVGEATTSILASSFDFLSGTGLLTFLCVICLLRIFIYKFKKE